jgi:hypothetical protein
MDVTLAGSSITYEPDDDQLGRVSLELAAMDGEIGYGQLPVNDALAAIDVATGRAVRISESNARVVDGFIVDHDRDRGPLPAGTAREYVYSVADPNAILEGFRVVRSRPSETDYARVIAFVAADMDRWDVDTTWVLSASPVTMPAKDYSGTGWSELITDLVEFTGKTLFVHDKAFGGRCLHYHLLTSGHTSTLTISDVPSAVNGITVFAPQSPTRTKTSMDLRNNIMGRDQSGRTSTKSDSTSITTHDADGLRHEELYDFEALSQADLEVKTAALLASNKEDTITYRCTIGPLDGTALTKIRVGDYITTTSSVMGLTASAQRISHMTLTPVSAAASGLGWNAALELGAPIRRRARVKPYIRQVVPAPTEPPPATLPFEGTGLTTLGTESVLNAAAIWSVKRYRGVNTVFGPGDLITHELGTPVIGASLENFPQSSGNGIPYEKETRVFVSHDVPAGTEFAIINTRAYAYTGFSGVYATTVRWQLRTALFDPTTGPTWDSIRDIIGSGTLNPDTTAGTIGDFDTVDPTIRIPVVDGRIQLVSLYDPDQVYVNSFQGGTWHAYPRYPNFLNTYAQSTDGIGHAIVSAYPSTQNYILTYEAERVPVRAQEVVDEDDGTGDGVTTLFSTDFPYLAGSLTVTCSGLPEYSITETDPTTGAYTFGSPPFNGEEIRTTYKAAGTP